MRTIEGFRERVFEARNYFVEKYGNTLPEATARAAYKILQTINRETLDQGKTDDSFWRESLRRESLIVQSVKFSDALERKAK